ncbi:tubulin binding cofactor A [Geopyxis carbonaria]|nr:tubulin binding cofactor A [Geopyxis carbonaria]
MPPPTSLAIKTSAVLRLIKEEASYHKEEIAQTARLERMVEAKADEYEIRQQQRVVSETQVVVPPVREKLKAAIEILEYEIEASESESAENKEKAQKAIEDGKKVLATDP